MSLESVNWAWMSAMMESAAPSWSSLRLRVDILTDIGSICFSTVAARSSEMTMSKSWKSTRTPPIS